LILTDRVVGLFEAFCPDTFHSLRTQKEAFLRHDANALYPTDSSVFSAATFELGSPHCRTFTAEIPDRQSAGTWSILTALGMYSALHGGHVIFWDLGLVVAFPPGASILVPSIIRYSFVRVRPGERRYALLQWAGSGISRWFQNGRRTDIDFAVHATREQHAVREERRSQAHAASVDEFPIASELSADKMVLPFFGTNPTVVV
jgi:hypothetical protein